MQHIETMPCLKDLNGRRSLYVDGKPFIILGLQWDCDWCYTPEDMDFQFAEAKKMRLNTASLLLYWREVEPEKGVYDFTMLDHRIEMARRHNMKIVLVWFASFKNACLTYAPDYIRANHKEYRKVHKADGSLVTNCCCPTAKHTHERDELALIEVFKHLKEVDREQHTVILFQMQNEVGILDSDRCHCPTCEAEFVRGKWAERYGWLAGEAFTAAMIADYCDSLTKTVKDIYPLPVYMNAALPEERANSTAGNHFSNSNRVGHFNGGPVRHVLPIWRERIKHVDFLSPDIYQPSYRDFRNFCAEYSWEGNPLYVAECATGKGMRAERNAIYAVAEFAAIGFDPWSMTRNCPDFMGEPLVNPCDLRWSDDAHELLKSYKIIADVMQPLCHAQNTKNLGFFVQEAAEVGRKVQMGDVWVELRYSHPLNAARGLIIKLAEDEYVISGLGTYVQFSRIWGEALPIEKAEVGYFVGDEWHKRFLLSSEIDDETHPVSMRDAMTVKFKLGKRLDHQSL
jgi:hypothetical protein